MGCARTKMNKVFIGAIGLGRETLALDGWLRQLSDCITSKWRGCGKEFGNGCLSQLWGPTKCPHSISAPRKVVPRNLIKTRSHKHTHTHALAENFSRLSLKVCCQMRTIEVAIKSWMMTLKVTLTIWSRKTFEGFYEVSWQSFSVDKLQSVFAAKQGL